jgi:hypothetical protein
LAVVVCGERRFGRQEIREKTAEFFKSFARSTAAVLRSSIACSSGSIRISISSSSSLSTSSFRDFRGTTMSLQYIAPLLEMIQDPKVQAKVEDVARFFYSNNSVTINLAAVAAAAALGLLLLGGLLFILFQPSGGETGGTGYGDPYGTTGTGYGAPQYSSSRSGEGFEEFRSLFTNLLSPKASFPAYNNGQAIAPEWQNGVANSANLIE